MKLLSKSLLLYFVYAIIIFIMAVPFFYFGIQKVVKEDADENLVVRKNELVAKLQKRNIIPGDFCLSLVASGIELTPLKAFIQHDSIYNLNQFDSVSQEIIPYRIYESNITIDGKPWKLKLKDSLIDTEDLIESIVKISAIILFCIIAGLYLINLYISKKTWKPFYNTLEQLHKFRVDKQEPLRLPQTNITEFGDLNKAITNLANTNQQVYQLQKEFAENASHEMQTPVAILQGKVELLMQTTPLTSEQAQLITDAQQTSQRISKLNKTLILLTKIENNQFPETEKINLGSVIQSTLAHFQNAIADKKLSIDTPLIDASFVIANRSLIEILVANLLTNAIRHNNKGGVIKISVLNNVLSVANSGDLKQLDSSRLFQRFQKQTSYTESLGLGLALVQKICNLYDATVNYSFAEGLHVFTVSFSNRLTY